MTAIGAMRRWSGPMTVDAEKDCGWPDWDLRVERRPLPIKRHVRTTHGGNEVSSPSRSDATGPSMGEGAGGFCLEVHHGNRAV